MSSFFSSGTVDTNQYERDKLPCIETPDPEEAQPAIYRVAITDFADHYGAQKGDRSQINFTVLAGLQPKGRRGGHIVMHHHKEAWQVAKARGEIAACLGAFMGLTRDASGLKITADVYGKNTRALQYNENGKVAATSRSSDELPLVQKQAEAFLVVAPYFDKKSGKRKTNKGKRSVTYEFFPLSANMEVTPTLESGEFTLDDGDDFNPGMPADDMPAEAQTDALEKALADGWKVNKNAPEFFFKKGEPKQLKEAALRAMYGG